MNINAEGLHFKELNQQINATADSAITIRNCNGLRYIGSGIQDKTIEIHGTPGNALGVYLNGASITVYGNAQDAVGDTMNDGRLVIHGHAGDALGYAMRGGAIYVRGDAGYRTGIHMKEYQDKKPVIVVGGKTGCFLGEYLAGGLIVVLGLNTEDIPIDSFTGTGMHGGQIFIRTHQEPTGLPEQVSVRVATQRDLDGITHYINEFARFFGVDAAHIMNDRFYVLTPNAKNPYKQLYTAN